MATNRCFWSEKGSKVNQRAVSKEKSLINTRALRPKTRHVHPLQNVKYFFLSTTTVSYRHLYLGP